MLTCDNNISYLRWRDVGMYNTCTQHVVSVLDNHADKVLTTPRVACANIN